MKRVGIGGQAVLEGIMMKGPDRYSLAVRKEDGEIALEVHDYKSFSERKHLDRIPLVRGVVNFVESLYIGMKTLMASSEYFMEEEEEESSEKAGESAEKAAQEGKKEEKKEDTKEEKEGKGYLVVALLISLAFAIGVFILLPSFLANLLYKVTDSHILVNTCEGLLRLLIFLGYIILISQMKDIKRTFMYHGAEHKAINCLEAGNELTPENVLKATRFHRRCGTSFVFIVMIISILMFMFIRTDTVWLRFLSRLLLIPVVAGLSYEVIRYAGRHNNACSRIMSAPGLWVQRITTREPDYSMAEVAIKAVDAVIDWREYVECVRNDSFEK
ncbi:MAG: DUF1385 domain-containing protein [Eubacterium sp.]|nr:DUF1385 domain-containing protein [Eubacterium sp.]